MFSRYDLQMEYDLQLEYDLQMELFLLNAGAIQVVIAYIYREGGGFEGFNGKQFLL